MRKFSPERKVTIIFLVAIFLIGLIWDVKVAYNHQSDDTISEVLRDLSHAFYSFPFAFMAVMGHFFWNIPESEMLSTQKHRSRFWNFVALPFAVILARDIVNLKFALPEWDYANLFFAAIGFFVGAKFWPQAIPEKGDSSVEPD